MKKIKIKVEQCRQVFCNGGEAFSNSQLLYNTNCTLYLKKVSGSQWVSQPASLLVQIFNTFTGVAVSVFIIALCPNISCFIHQLSFNLNNVAFLNISYIKNLNPSSFLFNHSSFMTHVFPYFNHDYINVFTNISFIFTYYKNNIR